MKQRDMTVWVIATLIALFALACTGTTTSESPDGDESDGDVDITYPNPDGDVPLPDGDLPDGDGEPKDQCGVGDDEKEPGTGMIDNLHYGNKVFNGTEAPTQFTFTDGQVLAMGALIGDMGWGNWSNFCSGTLVAPRVVLTAAHCLEDISSPTEVKFVVGPDASRPLATFDVEQVYSNPEYSQYTPVPAANDNGLLILTQPATDILPEIRTIPINETPLERSLIGQMVQNGGYGSTQNNDYNSLRWWISERVDAVGGGEFTVNGMGLGGVCFGDSGGPSFYDFGEGLRVIGTVSWGDQSCSGVDHFGDVQYDRDWLMPIIDSVTGCGELDEAGYCSGDVAIYCENDKPVEVDCRAETKICGQTGGQSRCVPDPCDGITWEGVCAEGDVVKWCQDGEIKQRHCIPCGQSCGWAGDALGYYCVDEEATGSCGLIDAAGCCANGVAFWCDETADVLHSQNCGDKACGWDAGSNGYFCDGSGEDPSGEAPLVCPVP